MENPRAEKVAVVDEVRERLNGATGSVITEYRGLTVAQLADLRQRLAAAGSDYKVYKNTLVKLAISSGPHESLGDYLSGPTAIAFVHGDVSAVAKALRDFARTHPALVIKGGLLDGASLSTMDLTSLADLPSRDVLLARLAGAIAAPLQTLAGLLQALPRNLAYGLSALIDEQGGVAEAPAAAEVAEAPVTEDAVTEDAATEDAATEDAPAEAVPEAAPAEALVAEAEAPTEAVPEAAPAEALVAEAEAPTEAVEAEAEAPNEVAEADTEPAVADESTSEVDEAAGDEAAGDGES
jgi:large subunit ribosomal protein L10